MTRRAPIQRRGLTFLEVVVSLTMVAGMAALVTGAVSFLENAVERDRKRLAAMEVAHRVILQYIDDFKWIRSQANRVDHGPYTFEFEFEELFLRQDGGVEGGPLRGSAVRGLDVPIEDRIKGQIHQLSVDVYLVHARGWRSERPLASLVRFYNPILNDGKRGIEWLLDQMEQYATSDGEEDEGEGR